MAVASCGDDEDRIVPSQMNYSAGYLSSCLDGSGWKYVESHEVNKDGSFDKEDFWVDVYNGTPDQYMFKGDTITAFSYIADYPLKGFKKSAYRYNEQTNQLMSGDEELFKVLTVSENTLRIIKYNGLSGDGKKTYLYEVYRKMSYEELDYYRSTYLYNIAKLDVNYPVLPEKASVMPDNFTAIASEKAWQYVEGHEVLWSKRYKKEQFYSPEIYKVGMLYVSADSISFMYPNGSYGRYIAAESMKYGYRANSSAVVSDGNVVFYLYSLDENTMEVVIDLQQTYKKKKTALFCKYRRLTDEERENLFEKQ